MGVIVGAVCVGVEVGLEVAVGVAVFVGCTTVGDLTVVAVGGIITTLFDRRSFDQTVKNAKAISIKTRISARYFSYPEYLTLFTFRINRVSRILIAFDEEDFSL